MSDRLKAASEGLPMFIPVLVTGGAGYIGSHACKALRGAGYLPIVYDNLEYGHEWAVKWGPFERGDVLDRDRLSGVLGAYRPRAVLHFAAYASVAQSVADPGRYYYNNALGTLSLLNAMVSAQVDRLVFSSSCATYGTPERLPIVENTPQVPINPYGMSKLMAERIIADFATAHGMRSITLRYFNAAGADPEGEVGEDHVPETHLLPLVLQAALGVRAAVTVYGADYPTPDGTCLRDYVHVSDLATAHVLALNKLMNGVQPRQAYNLGGCAVHSVNEVIRKARQITGRSIAVAQGARRPGDAPALYADGRLARRELGWRPGRADLDDMLESAWRWMRSKEPRASAGIATPPPPMPGGLAVPQN